MTHYLIYKTTNVLNGHYYIGKHKTENVDDAYLGSGKRLQLAIKKYGRESFIKEILRVCSSEEEMNLLEEEIVTDNLVADSRCYNMKTGGYGGWDHITREHREKSRTKVDSWSNEHRQSVNSRKARPGEKNGMYGRDRSGENNPRFGAVVSEDTKKKISLANSGRVSHFKGVTGRWSVEQLDHMRKLKIGKRHNDETKERISRLVSSTKWWNDGQKNVRASISPGEEWRNGRLPFRKSKNGVER